MNKIISITGKGNSGHLALAMKLSKNSAIGYIKPYTDREYDELWEDCYNFVSSDRLDELLEEEEALYNTMVNGHRYVFFKNQLVFPYNVLILDDYGVVNVRSNYKQVLYTIKCYSRNQKDSDRVGVYLFNHEFDDVFDYDNDDYDELEARIDYYEWK